MQLSYYFFTIKFNKLNTIKIIIYNYNFNPFIQFWLLFRFSTEKFKFKLNMNTL